MNYLKKAFVIIFSVLFALATYAKDYQYRIDAGKKYASEKNYMKAINLFQSLLNLNDISEEQKNILIQELSRCKALQAAAIRAAQFSASPNPVEIPALGCEYFEVVISGSSWSVVDSGHPAYISAKRSGNKLLISADANYDRERDGHITIRMNGKSTNYVNFTQPVVTQTFNISTEPVTNSLYMDGSPIAVPYSDNISSAPHRFTKKETALYNAVDTIINLRNSATNSVTIALKPKFAVLRIQLPDKYNYNDFDKEKSMRITFDKTIVRTDNFGRPDAQAVYDSPDIQLFCLYRNNSIPVPPGKYKVTISDNQLYTYEGNYEVKAGQTYTIGRDKLQLNLGKINFNIKTSGSSDGMAVYADGNPVSTRVDTTLSIVCGKHTFSFSKDNYHVFAQSDTSIQVLPTPQTIYVVAHPVGYFDIQGTPKDVNVKINGIDNPRYHNGKFYAKAGKSYLEITRDGYQPYKAFDIDVEEGTTYSINYNLPQLVPFELKCDESNLTVELKRDGAIFCSDSVYTTYRGASTTIYVPEGTYDLRLLRKGKTAYRGKLRNDPSKGRIHKVYSNSHWYFNILAGEFYFIPSAGKWTEMEKDSPLPFVKSDYPLKSYSLFADARFCQFKLFPGFTTSLLKASFFKADKDVKDSVIETDNDFEKTKIPSSLMGFSCLFLNDDFRIGGAVYDKIDVSFLANYTWCPPVKSFLPLSHFDGHEMFFGLEASSRIPVFNANLRMGFSILKGNTNIYREPNSNRDIKTKNRFVTNKLNATTFTIAIGFTLGTRDSKGQNILRVF